MNTSFLSKCMGFLLIFIIVSGALFFFKSSIIENGINWNFLMGANILLLIVTVLGFRLQLNSAKSSNTNAFLRGIYSSLLLKMFTVIIVIAIYIGVAKGTVDTVSILVGMGLYILYSAVEVSQLMKIVSQKPNA